MIPDDIFQKTVASCIQSAMSKFDEKTDKILEMYVHGKFKIDGTCVCEKIEVCDTKTFAYLFLAFLPVLEYLASYNPEELRGDGRSMYNKISFAISKVIDEKVGKHLPAYNSAMVHQITKTPRDIMNYLKCFRDSLCNAEDDE